MDTIVAETQSANTRSRTLLEKMGFVLKEELERFGARQCVYELKIHHKKSLNLRGEYCERI